MLSNAYVLANFRFDTAENEPAKNLQNFEKKAVTTTVDADVWSRRAASSAGRAFPALIAAGGSAARAPSVVKNLSKMLAVGKAALGRGSAGARGAPRATRTAAAHAPGLEPETAASVGRLSRDAANFTGLVLGCIETRFCKKICV